MIWELGVLVVKTNSKISGTPASPRVGDSPSLELADLEGIHASTRAADYGGPAQVIHIPIGTVFRDRVGMTPQHSHHMLCA